MRKPRKSRASKPVAKAPDVIELYLGDEHWCAAVVPAADQIIVLANRDRDELSRMLAAWQARPLQAAR
jgi:hypothetical protein